MYDGGGVFAENLIFVFFFKMNLQKERAASIGSSPFFMLKMEINPLIS